MVPIPSNSAAAPSSISNPELLLLRASRIGGVLISSSLPSTVEVRKNPYVTCYLGYMKNSHNNGRQRSARSTRRVGVFHQYLSGLSLGVVFEHARVFEIDVPHHHFRSCRGGEAACLVAELCFEGFREGCGCRAVLVPEGCCFCCETEHVDTCVFDQG